MTLGATIVIDEGSRYQGLVNLTIYFHLMGYSPLHRLVLYRRLMTLDGDSFDFI